MAPTGRAAKILREKTGEGETIHRGIYNFSKLETINDDSEELGIKSYKYYFPIQFEIHTHRIAIVDEASMISDAKTEHELFRFGSGKLLTDLLQFMQLHQQGNKVIFVRKLKEGGSEHSFGIHVAKMAGMPTEAINRANEILAQLEKSHSHSELTKNTKKNKLKTIVDDYQLSFIQLDDPLLLQIKEDILNTDIDTLTPVEALMKLNEIKKLLGK